MAEPRQTVLRFVLKSPEPFPLAIKRFHPQGKVVLNRTEWRGKEPRSCAVTSVRSPSSRGAAQSVSIDVEVTYRPKGCIVYVGNSRYDGWTLLVLDRTKDGVLLDGHGAPLPAGESPVYLPFEVFEDVEFNQIDFGEFVGEFEVGQIKHFSFDDVIKQLEKAQSGSMSIKSTFMAPRRNRPQVKVVLSNSPSGTASDGWGTRIININSFTPHLKQVLLDEITEVVNGFIEGRYSMKNVAYDEFVFAELYDVFVDATQNQDGKEPRFNCLNEYVPETFLEDLAKRLMATYEVEVSVVDWPKGGILLRRASGPNSD